jgi:thiol-disulfide isomerase/thioredoxin
MLRPRFLASLGLVLSPFALNPALANQPSVSQALALVPMQQDVQYDRPDEATHEACTIQPEREGDARAWVVMGPDGSLIRRFSDTNGDNKIDQWCYFRGGVEVYRDIDADFNEKADQYRWFGTEGMRWGLDRDEDGTIDEWKWISPEEVTAELVRAVREKNAERFAALVITEADLDAAGVTADLKTQLLAQATEATAGFADYLKDQTVISDKSRWVDFSAPHPGVIPTAAGRTTRDLVVYENVIAMVETEGNHGEIYVGTLLRVEDRWRLIGLPKRDDGGFFFRASERRTLPVASVGGGGTNAKTQELVQRLETLDQQLTKPGVTPQQTQQIYRQRIALLRELVTAAQGEERDMWLLQLIDSVVATSQPTENTDGLATLEKLAGEVAAVTQNKEIVGQARFAYLTAEYSDSLQKPDPNLAKIQDGWIANLKQFVTDFAGTRPAAEAMLQLAISDEFAGDDKAALAWYARIVKEQPNSDMAAKAQGAARRLASIGKPLELKGRSLTGSPMDLAELQGNLVVVQYWATWCEPCKQDMLALQKLLAQYGRRKFAVVGVNLDTDPRLAAAHLKQTQQNWPQLHDQGGLESKLAKEMGIFTLPLMVLVDERGRVVNRSISIPELEAELQKRRSTKRGQ